MRSGTPRRCVQPACLGGLAERLAAALAQAEQGIPRSRLERLASFKGLVRVSPDHHSHQQEPK
jgi:hypothetical protein